MFDQELIQRVASVKTDLASCAAVPRNKVVSRPVLASVWDQLADTPGFPKDMLLVLREVGEMLSWSVGECAAMEWWIPCDIDHAKTQDRWVYNIRKDNFVNGEHLLFFAWDCDAKVYFYDTTVRPWPMVASDGLMVSDLNKDRSDRIETDDLNQPVMPWTEDSDFVSLIETWVAWAKSCSRID